MYGRSTYKRLVFVVLQNDLINYFTIKITIEFTIVLNICVKYNAYLLKTA